MRLCGLKVSNLDGTTGSFGDPDENREKYPQPKSQKAGLGFSMWRVVVLISAVTAMVQMVAVGPWRGKGTGEAGLFVSLFEQLREAASWIDVIVADKYYCSYHMIAVLIHFNIRFVTRLHGNRLIDFADAEKVQRQCNGDFHVVWNRPERPSWMLDWMWNVVLETMTLRLVRVRADGARTKGFFVVTNLADDKAYPSEAIRELYRGRWNIEVDLRTIKSFMKMEFLRAKTPEMVETEFAMGLLAYNVVRAKMLETAITVWKEAMKNETTTRPSKGKTPGKNKIEPEDLTARNVSFSVAPTSVSAACVTIHFMSESMCDVYRNVSEANRHPVPVGNRPDRVELRCNKRRRRLSD